MPYSKEFIEANPELVKQRQNLANAKWREAHPEESAAIKKAWYDKNRERQIASSARWRATHQDAQVNSHLKRKFGITLDDYNKMLKEQGGVCAVCGGPPSGRWKHRFHVDHDHVTGKVRGLVCFHCNAMMGNAHDGPAILEAGAAYLRKHQ